MPARSPALCRLVGGKGGVGKTTCAAALAIAAARRGRRTLLVTIDPAPSLGDALCIRLGPTPRPVPATDGMLHAMELDARTALEGWLKERAGAIEALALQGTWLDRDDVRMLMGLSLPGLDEIAALLELSRLRQSARWNLIVVDAAPTGHTLRLLDLPRTFEGVARAFGCMQQRHRAVVEALTGGWRTDAGEALVRAMFEDATALRTWLTAGDQLRVTWVTLPEPMATAETLDALSLLRTAGLSVDRLVINRALTAGPRCDWCDTRRALETRTIGRLAAKVRALPGSIVMATVSARDREPLGVPTLAGLARELARGSPTPLARTCPSGVKGRSPALSGRPPAPDEWSELQLLLFGGKGGVGKTTCAAAAALDLAGRNPQRRVLLLSTDPAHSLGDVLGRSLDDDARRLPVRGQLRARELDARLSFERVRERYRQAIDSMFDRLRGRLAVEAAYDRQVMRELLALSPPGLDELAAILEVVEVFERPPGERPFDLLVVDTAPTGHALRLLEMPGVMRDWAKALMRLVLKYEPLAGPGDLGALLLRLSRGLGSMRTLLADPHRAGFVTVTRTGALPAAELRRLHARLQPLGIRESTVILNAVGRGSCSRCRRLSRTEMEDVSQLQQWTGRTGLRLVGAPAELPPPRGIGRLAAWRGSWQKLNAPSRRRRSGS